MLAQTSALACRLGNKQPAKRTTKHMCNVPAFSPTNISAHARYVIYIFLGKDLFKFLPALIHRYGRNDSRDCPKLDERGSQTCMVPRNQNNGFSQLVRVTASNLLGSSTSEIRFNPETSSEYRATNSLPMSNRPFAKPRFLFVESGSGSAGNFESVHFRYGTA